MSTNPPDAEEPFGASDVDNSQEHVEPLAEVDHVLDDEAPEGDAATAGEHLQGDQLRGALEAILLIVDEPVGSTLLASVLAVPEAQVLGSLTGLRQEYDDAARGFELREIAGGWRLYTREEFAPFVERFVLEGQQTRLTQAALETLAVVAYRQPVSRSRVSAVRGVNVDGVMRTLMSRGLVEEAGSEESGAVLYRTTSYFLERLGLQSLEQLPNLANFLPESTTIEALEEELSSSGRDD